MLSESLIVVSCQGVTEVLYNQQLDYYIQNSPLLILVMCHFNPVHTSTPCFSRLHFKSITCCGTALEWNSGGSRFRSNPAGLGGGRRLVVFSVPSGSLRVINSIRSNSPIPKFLPTSHN